LGRNGEKKEKKTGQSESGFRHKTGTKANGKKAQRANEGKGEGVQEEPLRGDRSSRKNSTQRDISLKKQQGGKGPPSGVEHMNKDDPKHKEKSEESRPESAWSRDSEGVIPSGKGRGMTKRVREMRNLRAGSAPEGSWFRRHRK